MRRPILRCAGGKCPRVAEIYIVVISRPTKEALPFSIMGGAIEQEACSSSANRAKPCKFVYALFMD